MNVIRALKYCTPPIVVDAVRKVLRPPPVQKTTVLAVVNGVTLEFPRYHYLPETVAQQAFYDTALPQVSKFLHGRKPSSPITVIDVGANVGDTAASIASVVGQNNVRFICVEADDRYIPYLRSNTQSLDAKIVHAIAGAITGHVNASAVGTKGTSVIVEGAGHSLAVTLDELTDAPVDLLKIDTDGFEFEVLRGATRLLRQSDIAVFTEFSPQHIRKYGKTEPRLVLDLMQSAGFENALVYDGTGTVIGIFPTLGEMIATLSEYCERRPTPYYLDLLFDRDHSRLSEFAAFEFARMPKISPPE
jgi:FkbM family methyltransferase